MELEFIDFMVVMCLLVNGLMDSVMGLECILVMMGVAMLGNLNGVLNMD